MGRPHGAWREQESLSLTTFADATDAYKPLTYEQEQELGHRIQAGDMDAAEQLVLHNMKFCLSYARKFTGRGVPMDDLVASAYTGMIKASRRFKPGHGKFISYAVHEMRAHMQRAIARQCGAVSFPSNAVSYQRPFLEFFEKHNRESGAYYADLEQLAEEVGTTVQIATAVMGLFKKTVSLSLWKDEQHWGVEHGSWSTFNAGRSGATDGLKGSPMDFVVDEVTSPPDVCAEREDRRRVIELLMRGITKRQRHVINELYINGKEPIEVATELNVTRQAVFWTRDRGFRKMRRNYGRLMAQGVL